MYIFVLLLLVCFIIISSKKGLKENFDLTKCRKTNDKGEEVTGCYYENVIDSDVMSGSCFYSLPKDRECPNTYDEYKVLIDENDECDLEEMLFIMPQLTDEQLNKIESNEIKSLELNGKKINVSNISKCMRNASSLKRQLIDKLNTENFTSDKSTVYKNRCGILRGAAENSNNTFIRKLLSDVIDEMNCELNCDKKEEILSGLENKLIKDTGIYSKEKQTYFNSYKNLYNKKCESEMITSVHINEGVDGNNVPKNGYIIIPKDGKPPIYDFYDGNVSSKIQPNKVTFENRSDLIKHANKYICDRTPYEQKAYQELGENVKNTSWWKNK
jgi:hypothetical protein